MRPSVLPLDGTDAALGPFGYTPREWAFLRLSALVGGYFLRRQVAQFLGCKDGGRVTQFVQRTLDLEHAQCSTWRQGVQLYHLSARPLYAALGEPDNRNRRRHEWAQTKNRVMRLDLVLAHTDESLLATEREKVEHFAALGVPSDALPQTRFTSSLTTASTTRFFTDRYPIFTGRGPLADRATTSFSFVDEGLVGLSRFENFLGSHRLLFESLPAFSLIYGAETPRHFARAQALFERFCARGPLADSTPAIASPAPLEEYFRLRDRFEARDFGALSRADLIRLRDMKARFSGAEVEGQFAAWRARRGAVAPADLGPISNAEPTSGTIVHGTFLAQHLRHDYSFFGGYGQR
jgi:hypothetical protein